VLNDDAAHVVDDRSDNIVNNGVIQPINRVLMPPAQYLTAETLAQVLLLDDTQFKDIFLAFMLADMINLIESKYCTYVDVHDSSKLK